MNFMPKKQALACVVLALAGVAGAQASEIAPMAAPSAQMTPAQRAAYLHAVTASRTPGAHATAGSKVDVTPPTLTSFNVLPPADAAAPLAQLQIQLKAADDLSGVSYAYVQMLGPHDQWVYASSAPDGIPGKTFSQRLATSLNAYLEPGTWQVNWIGVGDAAGNFSGYDVSALASLGNVQFTIANSKPKAVDYTPGAVTQGTVVTPVVSASAYLKGTTAPAMIEADFTSADAGSGVQSVYSSWCLADASSCFGMSAYDAVRGDLKKTLRPTAYASWIPPGDYLLQFLEVEDQAGNWTSYYGTDFGGDTDFSTLMPGGHTITVTP
jgi:hypothetical protein